MNEKKAAIINVEATEVTDTEARLSDKTQYIVAVMEERIQRIKDAKRPYINDESGEVNRLLRAESKRADKLIEQMQTSIRVAKALDGTDYTLRYGVRKVNLFGYIRAAFDIGYRRSHSIAYHKKYFGSIRWILQRANQMHDESDDTQPIRSLQAKVRKAQKRVNRMHGLAIVGWYTKR